MIKKLLPVLAVLAAALIVVSTGAFTSITAERTAEIHVAGDASALLTLGPGPGANAAYVGYDADGAGYLNFGNVKAEGVNVDAVTTFDGVFTVTNNGTQAVSVTLSKEGANTSAIAFGPIESKSGVTLKVGETYTVSITVDSHDMAKGDNILTAVVLTATAVVAV